MNVFRHFGGCFLYELTFNRLYDRLIDFFNRSIKLFDLKINLLIGIDQIYIENDRFYIEIEIVDSDSLLDFESDRNRQLKSTVLESELSTIRFVSPNHISLHPIRP